MPNDLFKRNRGDRVPLNLETPPTLHLDLVWEGIATKDHERSAI